MNHHTYNGKWATAGIPKKGWSCVNVVDSGEPSQTCEMCEGAEIRYIHYMRHPDYPDDLSVGCVCAENMEQDYTQPKRREAKARNKAKRKKNWPDRQWQTSIMGNLYLNSDGFNITIYSGKTGSELWWKVRMLNTKTIKKQDGNKKHSSIAEAKSSAFEALMWAIENL